MAVYQYFNFVYCDVNRDIQQINLRLILQPFDNLMWLCLCVGGIAVKLTILTAYSSNSNTTRRSSNISRSSTYYELVTATFMTISGIFSDTITLNNRSKFLLVWLVVCFILNNMYSGALTSLLIAPFTFPIGCNEDCEWLDKEKVLLCLHECGLLQKYSFYDKIDGQEFPPPTLA